MSLVPPTRTRLRRLLVAAGVLVLATCGRYVATALDLRVMPTGLIDQIEIQAVRVNGASLDLTGEQTLFPSSPRTLEIRDVLTLWFADDRAGKDVSVTAVGRWCGQVVTDPATTTPVTLVKGKSVEATLALGVNRSSSCDAGVDRPITGGAGTGGTGSGGTSGGAGTGGGAGRGGTGVAGAGGGPAGMTGGAGTTGAGGVSGMTGAGGIGGGVAGTAAGRGGTTAVAGTTGVAGTTAAAGRGGTTGVAGSTAAAGRGGTTGVAGTTATAGTSGAAGRGGTTGAAGTGAGGTVVTPTCSGTSDGICPAACAPCAATCGTGQDIDCKLGMGTACTHPNQCPGGNCVDNVCCNTACGGPCDTCSTGTCRFVSAGGAGSPACTPYRCSGSSASCPTTCANDADCNGGNYFCSGTCMLKKSNGGSCSINNECTSGFCVDNTCCEGACGSVCDRCNRTGMLGMCVAAAAGSSPSGAGCGAYACNGTLTGCPTSCSSNTHCTSGNTCQNGSCATCRQTGGACASTAPAICCSGACVSFQCL